MTEFKFVAGAIFLDGQWLDVSIAHDPSTMPVFRCFTVHLGREVFDRFVKDAGRQMARQNEHGFFFDANITPGAMVRVNTNDGPDVSLSGLAEPDGEVMYAIRLKVMPLPHVVECHDELATYTNEEIEA